MANTFLERNKKKSLLALLLLFLRQRKMLVLLVFLMMMASGVFLGPSSWITGLPGGTRFAAGMAWIAGKMGVDVSKWGLGPEHHSYQDLLLAFQEARLASGSGPIGNGVGWGAFFQRAAGPVGAVPNSVDMVKGTQADLATAGTVAGIVNPEDAPKTDDPGVEVTPGDMGGVREAFAGGFVNGLLGAGSGGDAALSGGAYASKQFFSGNAGATSNSGALAQAGMSTLTPVTVPTAKIGGPAKGALSAMGTNGLNTRASKNMKGANSLLGGTQAFSQLAVGNALDQMSTQYCQPPSCPGEYATTTSGAVYDGNYITAGILTGSDPAAVGAGLIAPVVDVPPASDVGGGTGDDPNLLSNCESTLNTCENGKVAAEQTLTNLQTQISALMAEMPGECGNPCSCNGCTSLQHQITNLCDGTQMQTTIATVYTPCTMPPACNTMGITDPTATNAAPQQSMCNMNFGKCGPNGLIGEILCLLGS